MSTRTKAEPIQLSKYHVEIVGLDSESAKKGIRAKRRVMVDVYDVLKAFGVTDPAQAHGIKKGLKPGQRGHKTRRQDLEEAKQSFTRAQELGEDDGDA